MARDRARFAFSNEDWSEILKRLPAKADGAAVRAALGAVREEYQAIGDAARDGLPLQARRWREVNETLASKNAINMLAKLKRLAREIGPDPYEPEHPEWLLQLADDLSAACENTAEKAAFRAKQLANRDQWLLFRIFDAWEGLGHGKLSQSSDGPLVEFALKVTELVCGDGRRRPLGSAGIKKAVKRYLDRRREWRERWRLTIDEGAITVIHSRSTRAK
jgi:hypothetical protein